MKLATHTCSSEEPLGCLTRHVQHDGAKLTAPQAFCRSDDIVARVPLAHTEELDGAIVEGADSVLVSLLSVYTHTHTHTHTEREKKKKSFVWTRNNVYDVTKLKKYI
jgi:hypothetical protein